MLPSLGLLPGLLIELLGPIERHRRLFILHFLCTRPPWVCNETNTSRRERAAPSEEDTRLTLREQRHAVVGKSSPAPHCPFSLPLPVIDPEMNLFILLTITHSGAEVFRLR